MRLAINYSHEAAALLAAGSVQFEIFKCPDWPDLVSEAMELRQVAVHFALRAGSGKLERKRWDRVEALLKLTSTPYVNLHLHAKTNDFPEMLPEKQSPDEVEQVHSVLLKDVMAAVRRFGAERVIIENIPFRGAGGKALRTCVEPSVIRSITDETGCGLLLDISHARISAQAMGMDAHTYMEQLPRRSLKELHFTGLEWMDGRLQDHLPARAEDWPELEWVLKGIRERTWALPWLLAFEYGGIGEDFTWRSDAQVMAVQIPHLRTLVQSV